MVSDERKALVGQVAVLQERLFKHLESKGPRPWIKLDMTREQLRVAFLIAHDKGISPSAVAGILGVPKANVTGVIDRLVKKGIVNRKENPKDRRSYILTMTAKGEERVAQLKQTKFGGMTDLLIKIPEEALLGFANALKAMLEVVEGEEKD